MTGRFVFVALFYSLVVAQYITVLPFPQYSQRALFPESHRLHHIRNERVSASNSHRLDDNIKPPGEYFRQVRCASHSSCWHPVSKRPKMPLLLVVRCCGGSFCLCALKFFLAIYLYGINIYGRGELFGADCALPVQTHLHLFSYSRQVT